MVTLNGVYFTVRELAEKWGCAVVAVNYYIKKNVLQATKVGQTYLVPRAEVEKFNAEYILKGKTRFGREQEESSNG